MFSSEETAGPGVLKAYERLFKNKQKTREGSSREKKREHCVPREGYGGQFETKTT